MKHVINKHIKENMRYHFYKICFAFVLLTFISCQGKLIRHKLPLTIENQCFTMNFEKTAYDMADVDKYFFTTFPHDDPTKGDVVYDRHKWINNNMIKLIPNDGLYLYVKQRNGDNKFDSVRMTSKSFYNINKDTNGLLFIFKGKLPSNKGIWPAWWLNGSRQEQWLYKDRGRIANNNDLDTYSGKGHFYDTPSPVNSTDWPGAGEIDIIETINGDNLIHNTIHTCPTMCDAIWNHSTSIINCANAKPGVDPNSGCSGTPYHSINAEGTFVCLWKNNSIHYYYWGPDENVHTNGGPLSLNPDPLQWRDYLKNEVLLTDSKSECNAAIHQEWQCQTCAEAKTCSFRNMKIIFNITLCGIWAGNFFDDSDHAMQNCQAYIQGEGKNKINNQYMKIEFISIKKL
jgi:hypothetical protein